MGVPYSLAGAPHARPVNGRAIHSEGRCGGLNDTQPATAGFAVRSRGVYAPGV
jgi:hypothetical protein